MQSVLMLSSVSTLALTSDRPGSNLSNREFEVLQLLVEGHSNPEIAARLYLSPNTVKTYVRSIFNKFGVNDRLQAAVFAVRNQIV